MERIEGSEMSAYIYQTPGNYPKENLLYPEHGESLKSRILEIIISVGKSLRVKIILKIFVFPEKLLSGKIL
jgi:hypothetical protein